MNYIDSDNGEYSIITACSAEGKSYGYDSDDEESYNFFELGIAEGCGFIGSPDADENCDGTITVRELNKFLNTYVDLSVVKAYNADDAVDFW